MTAAVALANSHDIKVDIYESAHAFHEIGAGVVVWHRPWKLLVSLGLEEDLKKLAVISDDGLDRMLTFFLCYSMAPSYIIFRASIRIS